LTLQNNTDRIPVEGTLALTQRPKAGERSNEIGPFEAGSSAEADGFIAVIESRTFIRECIRRSVQSAFPLPVLTYSTAVELGQQHLTSPQLIIFSWVEDNREASISALKVLSDAAPRTPAIVLAYNNDPELARTAICHGAKGYIPVAMGFEITVEAVRFVLAGGTYVPMDCLLARGAGDAPSQPSTSGLVTARELAVIRAIQKGKSNKIIAYELNMCESTVKVHVRNIMKKLSAKNRTDVAIKSQSVLSTFPRINTSFELST
jgi:DNA-binding NarL/FixJ family response regulator